MGLVVFVILALGGVGMLVLALRQNQSTVMDDRLASYTESSLTLEDMELQLPFRQRVLEPALKGLFKVAGKLSPARNADKVKHNLELGGNPSGLTPSTFVGLRVVLSVLLLAALFIITGIVGTHGFQRSMYTAVGGALGYILPGIWLDRKIKARKHGVLRALPDALDLLTISVEAGLGFDLALQRVADKWENELTKEFRRMISDARLGIPRRDALRGVADRCGVPELSGFVSAILQAEQLGASFGKILKVQSEQIRIRRRQRAEELAHQAPIKMLFPMAFLIFPSILVIILGPAMPKLFGGSF
ncbi:MAG: type II secretion system F family protein [Herpetosiphon sp.]